MRRRILLFLVIVSPLAPLACTRQQKTPPGTPQALDHEASWERQWRHTLLQAVAVQGKYAYVGLDRRLIVVDVSDPKRPAVTGWAGFWPDGYWDTQGVNSIAVSGSHAYVVYNLWGGHKRELVVFDVSDPKAPAVATSYNSAWGLGSRVFTVAVADK